MLWLLMWILDWWFGLVWMWECAWYVYVQTLLLLNVFIIKRRWFFEFFSNFHQINFLNTTKVTNLHQNLKLQMWSTRKVGCLCRKSNGVAYHQRCDHQFGRKKVQGWFKKIFFFLWQSFTKVVKESPSLIKRIKE